MARKKRQPGDRGPKKRRPKPLPDPRAMEGALQDLAAGLRGEPAAETPLDRAQEVIYQAFKEPDDGRRSRLAHAALELSPDCADAYVLLAEQAPRRKEALRLYEQGVAAGERALGPDGFERYADHFWGALETRPYMRARIGLAHALWTAGRRDEAVRHLQDMLRLNPHDNQGLRYTLAGFLLFLDRDDELAQLLEQFPDEGTASWAYTRALLAFRRQGDTEGTRRLLKKARKLNKYVPAYVTGEKWPPAHQRSYYTLGDESEAIEYVAGFLAAWKYTPGAVAWMRANRPKKKEPPPPQAKGPLGFIKKWLTRNLPQEEDVWQADIRRTPSWVAVPRNPFRPWLVLVASASQDLVLGHELSEEAPSAAAVWDALVKAMQHPVAGEPHRPTEIQSVADPRWEDLRPHLEEIGISLTVGDRLEEMESLWRSLFEHVYGKQRPGLLDVPGMTPAHAAGFYPAAADFFRAAPWKKVGYESALKIECDKFQSGPWYAVLMGQSGLTMGLAVYEGLEALQQLWESPSSEEDDRARQTVGTSVTYGEPWTTPVADLDAIEAHGWPVARPDAYPEVFHKERGLAVRPPLAWELELMEACLRTVPGFVDRHPQDDPTREELTVPAAGGELRLALSWVIEEGEG